MNLANSAYQEQEFEYNVAPERRSSEKEKLAQKKRAQYSRSNRPAVHNGIHRRRNKRFSW